MVRSARDYPSVSLHGRQGEDGAKLEAPTLALLRKLLIAGAAVAALSATKRTALRNPTPPADGALDAEKG